MISPTPILRPSVRRPARARVQGPARDPVMDALTRGLQLIAQLRPTILAFNFEELGEIDLPPETGSSVDQASLQSAAPLYLASELENAGLYRAIELLAGVFGSGSLIIPRGPSADRLAQFWRGRRDRLSTDERQAYFARLFGASGVPLAAEGGSNAGFELLMVDLTEALLQYVEHPLLMSRPGPREEARVRLAARQLAANLIPRSGGMTPFAAQDLLTTAKEALEILREADVQASFGARNVWDAVRNIQRRYGQVPENVSDHLTRGKAGMIVLGWLTAASTHLTDFSSTVLSPGDPVIAAATGWLQASLSLATAPPTSAALAVEGAPDEDTSNAEEQVVHTEDVDHCDKPLLSGQPLGARGEQIMRFTIPNGYRFSRWQVKTIDATPGAHYEVTQAPRRGAEGSHTLTIAWAYSPFGHIRLRVKAFASVSGTAGVAKIFYEAPGWLDQCRDQFEQDAPCGIAVRGAAAEALCAGLQQAVSGNSRGEAGRPFVAGIDDPITIPLGGDAVLVVIASLGFFVLHHVLQAAVAKGYAVSETLFKLGGGQGSDRLDSELVFNLLPRTPE